MSTAVVHSFSAATAGAVATLVTHPFDVIKVSPNFARLHVMQALIRSQTKIQVRQEERYHSFLRTVKTVWKVRGTAYDCYHFINNLLSDVVYPASSTVHRSGSPAR